MKKFILIITLFIFIAVFISEPKTCLAETENNSVNISYREDGSVNDKLNQFSLEYEYLLKKSRVSLFGRYSTADYKKGYEGLQPDEDGDIKGVDIGIRFYPIGHKRMHRLFFGGAFGYFQYDWEEYIVGYYQGTYSEDVTRLETEVGYRFTIDSLKVSVIPSAHLGYYFTDKSTLGIYAGFSISVGIAF